MSRRSTTTADAATVAQSAARATGFAIVVQVRRQQ